MIYFAIQKVLNRPKYTKKKQNMRKKSGVK